MTGTVYGKDAKQVSERSAQRSGGKRTPDEMRSRGLLVGTAAEIASQIRGYGEIGVYRVMVQWLDLDDIEGMEDLANELRR
jgi:alkanesulfonate monooxygenase SsuD/methylene tetrahydromethanopterin reductase-like flavin-dependent oxidoreductase (luciferase family)